MTLSLPEEMVESARREREESLLGPIVSSIDSTIRQGMAGLQSVVQSAAEQAAPAVRLLQGGTLEIPSVEDLTPQWLRDQYAPRPAAPQPDLGAPVAAPPAAPRPAAAGVPAAMPQASASGAAPAGGDEPMGEIIEGDPEGYFRTAGAYARQVERETGIPAALSLAVSANETGYGQRRYMAGANNYHGIQSGDGTGTPYVDWRPGPNGEKIEYAARQAGFATPLEGFRGFARFLLDNPRYKPSLDRYRETGDVNQLAADIHAAGYAEDPEYTTKIQSIIKGIPVSTGVGSVVDQRGVALQGPQPTTPPPAAQAQYAPGDLTPNQYNAAKAEGLDDETAWAVCGPAAAIAFARKNGRNPSMQEAVSLAREVGWTPQRGMAGTASQQKLLERMGVASRLEQGVNWQRVAADVQRGNPVIIDAGDHYMVAERYDPETGSFDFGQSAAVLRMAGGRRWFRPEELPGLSSPQLTINPTATLYLDNPASPAPSVAAGRVSLNAGASPPPATPSPAAPAGVSSAPAGAPPAPWETAGAQGGGQMMLKENDETANSDMNRQDPTFSDTFAPGDGGFAPTSYEQPYDPDQGPREATPGSVGSQPLPQPAYADPTVSDPAYTQDPTAASGVDPLDPSTFGPSALPASSAGPRFMQPQPAYRDPRERQGIIARGIDAIGQYLPSTPIVETKPGDAKMFMGEQPASIGTPWDKNDGLWQWRGRLAEGTADALARGLGQDPDQLLLNVTVGGVPIQMSVSELLENVTDPLLGAGFGVGDMVLDAAGKAVMRLVAPYAKGAARETIGRLLNAEPVQNAARAGMGAVREGADALGRGLQGVGREVAAGLMDLNPAMTPRMTGDAGPGIGRAMADGAGTIVPERPVYSPEPPAGVQRRYHGTAGAFDAPDPNRFDENGLYGPGYYTTSDPRVASSYADGRAPSTFPETLTADEAARLVDELGNKWGIPPAQRQQILSVSRVPSGDVPSLTLLDEIQTAVEETGRDSAAVYDDMELIGRFIRSGAGPNIRAIDVPGNVRLIDVDAPLDPNLLPSLQSVVARIGEPASQMVRELDDIATDVGRLPTPNNDAVVRRLFDAAERIPDMGKGLATEIMQRAGYDGIAHKGGQRVPMFDAAGNPIEHDVTVIFPDKLDKITNAFSGTPRGAYMPGFDPASAAAGGAAGAMSEDDQGNSGDPLRTAAGIGLGMLGSRMVRKPGHTVATGLKPGQRYEFRVRVVPLRDLITSHLDNLAVNRAFPGALQPRVRDRAASRVQIDKMVQAFDPEQVLMDTHRVDSGPMIVGPDMVVESGNGRGIALRRLAQENPEAYAQYVQALREELPYYGLTDDALQGIDQPVLVRERITPLDDAERARFASEANAPTAAQMSSMEQALADARSIGDGPLGRIVVGEDQTIDEALLSPENGAFVRAFMATVPDTERGKMLEANGNLSVTGLARVKAALLARTYPGAAGERVATAIVESTDAGLRNVQNAVMGSLPSMARVEGLIASGDVDGSLSLAADVAAAVDVYARLKRAGILVGDYLQQAGMFGGRETTPLQDAILGYLNDNARAPRRLRALLEGYAREVDEVAGAAGDMFGGPATAATKEELLDGVLRRLGAAPGADQGADLGRTGAGSNVVEGAGARQLAVPPADTGAQAGRGAGSPSLIDEVNAAETLTPEEQIARLQAENDRLRAERRGGGRRQQAQQPDPLQGANLPPVADDLIPSTGGEAGRLQMEGAPQPAPRPDPIPDIAPRTGGPEGTLAREGAPEPMPRPTPIPRDVLPSTGGEAGTLAQEGAPPTPARPLEEVVREIVGDGASRPAPVESPPGLNIRRLAKGIQLAAANPSPQIGLPGFPAPPPQAKPSWWDLAQTWRYSMGLFGQLSTALVQGLGGVAEVGLGAPSELIRQAVLRGHPEHVPLIIGEALKSVPRGAKEFGTTAMGRVPATIMAGSDYRPPLSDQLTGGARTAARLIETPGRVATQAPDAFWYEVFYRTGLAQAAAEQATRKGASRLDPVGSYRMQQELIENPTAEMIDRAHEFARSSTYKGELGSVAKAIGKVFRGPENPTSGLGKAWKEVGSFLMPVYHTIARIHEGALEYVPGIGALPLEAAGLAAKGRPLDQKIAQQAVGMAVAGSMLAYAAAGNVRGPGPNDPEKLKQMRDQGYEPNTTNVGGYWVPNAYFGRYGPILNAIGAMNDAVVYGDGQEKWNGARWDRQVKMVAKNFGRAFNDYPTAQAVSTLIKIKDDPVGALAEFAGGTAAQYVPAAYRSYATATDERVRRPERGKDVSPEQRFADTFAQRSGVGRQSLPEAQDVLGRPVENQRQGANVLFPRVGSDRPDRVIEAFQRVGVDIPKPADAFSIRNMVPESQRPPGSPSSFSVALTPEEQREWNTLRGQELIKQTEILLARRGWAEKPPAQRQADLNAALDAARRAADSAMQSKLGAREVNERIRSGLQKKAS